MTLRNVPDWLAAAKAAARKHRRSLNQQVLAYLEQAYFGVDKPMQDVGAELAEIAALRATGARMNAAEIDPVKRGGRP
jgi:hypothetical protein